MADWESLLEDLGEDLASRKMEIDRLKSELARLRTHAANMQMLAERSYPPTWLSREGWPCGVSDGLTIPCSDCGELSRFDYSVTDEFWREHVPELPARISAVCLPCLDKRCGGVGLAAALKQIQWTGTGHTVVLRPAFCHEYDPHHSRQAQINSVQSDTSEEVRDDG